MLASVCEDRQKKQNKVTYKYENWQIEWEENGTKEQWTKILISEVGIWIQ